MKSKTSPVVYRSRNQSLTAKNFKLSSGDLARIAQLRTAFEAHHNVRASTSVILSLAIEAMMDEVAAGRVRTSAEFLIDRSRLAPASTHREYHDK